MKILKITIILILTGLPMSINSQQSGKLVILHTNDLHSKLRGFAPETGYTPLVQDQDKTVGGFARLASAIEAEKNRGDDNFLVLDAGDFLMGTLFHHFEARDGFQLRLMKKMGYDVAAIGNHEFDFGPEMLAQVVESGVAAGEIPQLILSNVKFDKKDTGDDRIESLFSDGTIRKEFIIEKEDLGLKIGFFAIMGIDADDVAPAADPLTFTKQIRAARKLVKSLKKKGCNMIICLSHSGVSRVKDGKTEGEDFWLASKVKGIDIIISGHTHTKLNEPLIVKGIPIVQTGSYGENLGRITFNIVDGKAVLQESVLIAIDDNIHGDPDIGKMIDERIQSINYQLLAGLGMNYNDTIA
jgi:5'-nucleotidase / UDP-sugar diphosphatase